MLTGSSPPDAVGTSHPPLTETTPPLQAAAVTPFIESSGMARGEERMSASGKVPSGPGPRYVRVSQRSGLFGSLTSPGATARNGPNSPLALGFSRSWNCGSLSWATASFWGSSSTVVAAQTATTVGASTSTMHASRARRRTSTRAGTLRTLDSPPLSILLLSAPIVER